MSTEARRFFEALFGDAVCEAARLVLFALPTQSVLHLSMIPETYSCDPDSRQDEYFGVGLMRPGITKGRGTAADVVAITSLWLDIDLKEEPGRELLTKICPFKPTILNNSGHGLHPYWVFQEPLTDHAHATKLAARWSDTLRAFARREGHELDAVGDLARVLRVPGTLNHKTDPPVPVKLLEVNDWRYSVEDLEEWLDEVGSVPALPSGTRLDPGGEKFPPPDPGQLELREDAEPPGTKLQALSANNDNFRKAWEHKRKDLKDTSASSYDMALADGAVAAGWTDQEIANLIIAFRRKHRMDVQKACRPDYVRRTIRTARKTLIADQALDVIHEMAGMDETEPQPSSEAIYEVVSNAWGVPIERFLLHGANNEDCYFSLLLKGGREIEIGGPDILLSQARVRARLLIDSGKVLQECKKREWRTIVELLMKVVEVRENPESSLQAQLEEWLRHYLRGKRAPLQETEAGACISESRAYWQAGNLCLNSLHFRQWVIAHLDSRCTKNLIYKMLRAAEFVPLKVNGECGGERIQGRYWCGIWRKQGTTEDTGDTGDTYMGKKEF